MARALDHLVLPCADLAGATARFADLGFIVGRRNRHPWGTENHIVQFDGAFLELIAMAADAAPPLPDDPAFPFAGFLAGLGSSTHPSGMIVLRAEDAEADAAAFRQAGIGAGRRLDFARTATGPDGAPRTVSFSLAFADAPGMPDIGFFSCRQHAPEHFWNPAFQMHANGVTGVTEVVIVAADPGAHAPFLAAFADAPVRTGDGGGLVVDLGTARLAVTPRGPSGGAAPRLAAIRFAGAASPGGPRRIVTAEGLVLLLP